MKWSLFVGKIGGTKLYIHWTFVILLVWIFISNFRAGKDVQQGLWGVGFILILFACVLLHELGHAMAAKIYKIKTPKITLLPIGGVAQIEKMPEKPGQEFVVAIMGPLVNVVIGALVFLYLQISENFPTLNEIKEMQLIDSGHELLFNLFIANIILFIFNLVPAFPMDGGRILRSLLLFSTNRKTATNIAARIGQIIAVVFVILGLMYNPWLVFIALFIFLGAGTEAAYESARASLEHHKVSEVLMHTYTRLSPQQTIEEVVEVLLDTQEKDFVVMEGENVVGTLSDRQMMIGLAKLGKQTTVAQVMNKDVIEFDLETALVDVYKQIMTVPSSVFPISQNGRFIGIVNRDNINEFIQIQDAMDGKYTKFKPRII